MYLKIECWIKRTESLFELCSISRALVENKLGIFTLSCIKRKFYELISKKRKKLIALTYCSDNFSEFMELWQKLNYLNLKEMYLLEWPNVTFVSHLLIIGLKKLSNSNFLSNGNIFFLKNNIKTKMLFEMKLLLRFKVFLKAKLLVYNSAFVSPDC